MSTSISTSFILSQVNHVFCYVGTSKGTLRFPTCSTHQADHENIAENSWVTSHDPWCDPGLLGVSFILGYPLLPGYGTLSFLVLRLDCLVIAGLACYIKDTTLVSLSGGRAVARIFSKRE